MKFCILLSFFLTTLLWSQEKREKPLPKALFSIMLWNSQGSQDIAYAPWGNENEGNATIVPFTVSYGMPSRKCSFYGDGELNLLRQKEPHEFKEGENPYESVAKIRLPFSAEKPSDSLILLTPSAEEETWKTRNLSFDEKAIPKGHFTFSSQLSSPVGILFGQSKFTLSRGKTETIKVIPKDPESQVMELSAYLLKTENMKSLLQKMALFFRPSRIVLYRYAKKPNPGKPHCGIFFAFGNHPWFRASAGFQLWARRPT